MLEVIALAAQLAQSNPEAQQEQEQCISPEQVAQVYVAHHMTPIKLSGPELEAFHAAYVNQFHHPAPEDDLILMVERGEVTLVFSFKDNCMIGQGKTSTKIIHELLAQ